MSPDEPAKSEKTSVHPLEKSNGVGRFLWSVTRAVYIIFWDKKFSAKQRIARYAGVLLIVLIGIELAKCLVDVLESVHDTLPFQLTPEAQTWWKLHITTPVKFCSQMLLALFATLVVIHHRRLEARLSRHRTLIDMLRKLALDNPSESQSLQGIERFICETLECLIMTAQYRNWRKPCVSASLLLRKSSEERFYVYKLVRRRSPESMFDYEKLDNGQYPAGYQISGKNSAAAKVSKYSGEDSLYVPFTRFRHGVKITQGGDNVPRSDRENDAMHINYSPDSPDYRSVSHLGARRSCLLYRVPTNTDGERVAVVCMETNRRACLGELDFHAIQAFSMFLAPILNRANGAIWEKVDTSVPATASQGA
jgi:hypothetical protein